MQPSAAQLKDLVRSYWEAHPCGTEWARSEKFSRAYFDEIEQFRYAAEPVILWFADFPRWRGQRVLEVGVGAGTDFVQWLKAGARASGVDFTPAAIEHVRRRLALAGLAAADLRVADSEALPFPDSTFDLVYSWGVIHHTPDTKRALAEIVRVCRPGGRCKLMLYNRHSLLAVFLWIRWALLKGRPWQSVGSVIAQHMESLGTKAFTVAEVREMLNDLPVCDAVIRTVLTREDRLRSSRNPILRSIAGGLAQLIGDRAGWFMLIEFANSHQPT